MARSVSPVLVDTTVLSDVTTEDPDWLDWSSTQLAEGVGRLALNPVIYAGFSIHYPSIEQVEDALYELAPVRLAIPYEAAFLAGKVWSDR